MNGFTRDCNSFKARSRRKKPALAYLACERMQMPKKVRRECIVCGKSFRLSRYQLENRACLYCSTACEHVTRGGLNDPRYKGGYRVVGLKRKLMHRLVAEQVLGRPLTSEEVIHHMDEDHDKDAPENLMLFASGPDHTRFHRGTGEEGIRIADL